MDRPAVTVPISVIPGLIARSYRQLAGRLECAPGADPLSLEFLRLVLHAEADILEDGFTLVPLLRIPIAR